MSDEDYKRYRDQEILRDSLIRRNPLLAVPAPTRIPLSDQQAVLYPPHRSYPTKPQPSYSKSIYGNLDEDTANFYNMANYGEHSKRLEEDMFHSSRSQLTASLTGFKKQAAHMSIYSDSQTYPSEHRRLESSIHRIPPLRKYDSSSSNLRHSGNGYHQFIDTVTQQPELSPPNADTAIALSSQDRSGETTSNDPLLTKITTTKRKRVRGPKSWEYLLRLLRDPTTNPSLIRWENEKEGIFRLVKPDAIALRWGKRTGKHFTDMLSYENFARGLRYHYVTKALSAVSERCFVYKFGPKAAPLLTSVDALEMIDKSSGSEDKSSSPTEMKPASIEEITEADKSVCGNYSPVKA